ncbi:unnamed protein product [Mytilus coruscus]|uniref:Uncharacterized protein n=1 Tax=Mytilus coruscus TaxID=42192 RepID=A0A6J8DA34_MYTCO|nr:unnamed protein product [Mytilus coruscus]
MVDTLSPEDMESQMIVKLRRFYKRTNSGDSDELEELKIILRHHLQPDLVGAEKEFQEVFETLAKKKKIVLGDYGFLIATLSNIHDEVVNILKEYQTKITNLGPKEWHGKVADNPVERQIENKMKDFNIDISSIAEEHISQFKSEVSKYRLHNLKEAQYAIEPNHK